LTSDDAFTYLHVTSSPTNLKWQANLGVDDYRWKESMTQSSA